MKKKIKGKGWTNNSYWQRRFRSYSKKQFLVSFWMIFNDLSSWKGTVLPEIAMKEMARRKRLGLVSKSAGIKR